jgi:hypothetical protein
MLFQSTSFRLTGGKTVTLALCFGLWSGAHASPKELCSLEPRTAVDFSRLDACRPEPVTKQEKQSLLASLPEQGEIRNFSKAEKQKLTEVDRVLALHARKDVYAVKVIDVPQAWTGLYGRAVLLISALPETSVIR